MKKEKIKVGDVVRSYFGLGEVIYIDPDGDHAICVPGFKEGHRFESFPTVHMIMMHKGYSDEPCGWWMGEKKKKIKKSKRRRS